MGCGVLCAVSGVQLRGRLSVLLPLAPSRWAKSRRDLPLSFGATLAANEGAAAVYAPATFPVYATPDEFGGVESIRDDDHTAILGERLVRAVPRTARDLATPDERVREAMQSATRGYPPAAFARLARRVHKAQPAAVSDGPRWDGRLSGMWVARDVWEALSQPTDHHGQSWAEVAQLVKKRRADLRETRRKLYGKPAMWSVDFGHDLDVFAPEMLELYGPTFLGSRLRPQWIALRSFIDTLSAAGRLLGPGCVPHDGGERVAAKIARISVEAHRARARGTR